MSSRQLVVLGTSSQLPTRYRAHNSYALRWDDQLILFDPGEGTQRQCTLAGVAIARATAVCITHFHGDHSLGLPGVIQRRAHDARSHPTGLPGLPVFFPADGIEYFERMRNVSIFLDDSGVEPNPVDADALSADVLTPVGALGGFELLAAPLDHRVTTIGWRLQEPDQLRLDGDALKTAGIVGPAVGELQRTGTVTVGERSHRLEDYSYVRPGQSMAFIMDTVPCPGALTLAAGVDLLVCESTYLESERELAEQYGHMTAAQAAQLASQAGAGRLVLTHFSARYPDNGVFADEASQYHDDVVAAEDLLGVDVPKPAG